jgi:hypothetical protein
MAAPDDLYDNGDHMQYTLEMCTPPSRGCSAATRMAGGGTAVRIIMLVSIDDGNGA